MTEGIEKKLGRLVLIVVSAKLSKRCGMFSRAVILHSRRRWYLKRQYTRILVRFESPPEGFRQIMLNEKIYF